MQLVPSDVSTLLISTCTQLGCGMKSGCKHNYHSVSPLVLQVSQLKHTNSCLESEVRRLAATRQELEARARGMVDRGEMVKLTDKHKVFIFVLLAVRCLLYAVLNYTVYHPLKSLD